MPRVAPVDGLADLLDRQLAVASRRQLLALGLKDNAMQYRLRTGGPWQTLLPGVYLAASGVPSFAQKRMAALLYADPDSLITGRAATGKHRISPAPRWAHIGRASSVRARPHCQPPETRTPASPEDRAPTQFPLPISNISIQ